MIRRWSSFCRGMEARAACALAAFALIAPVAADPDLDRIEARLIQLEKELAVPAATLALSITPNDAVVQINNVESRHGQAVAFVANQPLQIRASGDKLKPFTATLTPAANQTRIAIELCAATMQEEYLFQPPDKVTTESVGTAERRIESACPDTIEEQRRLADQACAAKYPNASRNPGKQFSMQQPLFDNATPHCVVGAECVVRKTETPEKVKRMRDVDNARCSGRAELQ